MNIYTPGYPPKKGNARKIWKALDSAGLMPLELHYNPNLWGRSKVDGWGTWACTLNIGGEFFCGIRNGTVYLESLRAPYIKRAINP